MRIMVLIFVSSKVPSVGHSTWPWISGIKAYWMIGANIMASSCGVASALFSREIKRNSLGWLIMKVDRMSTAACNEPASSKLHPPWHNWSCLFVDESLQRSRSMNLIPSSSCFFIDQFWFDARLGGVSVASE